MTQVFMILPSFSGKFHVQNLKYVIPCSSQLFTPFYEIIVINTASLHKPENKLVTNKVSTANACIPNQDIYRFNIV